jgi:syntaxin 1B/2/3
MKLMDRTRRDNAQTTLSANRKRHEGIQKIEQDLILLAQLFQDLDTTVTQQEDAVVNIEQQGEQVEENVAKANVEIDGAITSARAARKKKFWCLGIARKSHYPC